MTVAHNKPVCSNPSPGGNQITRPRPKTCDHCPKAMLLQPCAPSLYRLPNAKSDHDQRSKHHRRNNAILPNVVSSNLGITSPMRHSAHVFGVSQNRPHLPRHQGATKIRQMRNKCHQAANTWINYYNPVPIRNHACTSLRPCRLHATVSPLFPNAAARPECKTVRLPSSRSGIAPRRAACQNRSRHDRLSAVGRVTLHSFDMPHLLTDTWLLLFASLCWGPLIGMFEKVCVADPVLRAHACCETPRKTVCHRKATGM